MKSAARKKIPPVSTLPVHHVEQDGAPPFPYGSELDSDALFLQHMAGMAKVTPKDIQYGLRVNKTTAYAFWNGIKPNPFLRARELLAMFPIHLYPPILEYIAGSDFDGDILTGAEHAALMVLAKRGSKKVKAVQP